MKPRIFVSSTYYDLKHVRERLEQFIDNYGFESVLFESDKVTYEFDKPIDSSAYNEVTLCHIMILIVGGRYGSTATNGNISEDIKKYEQEYISITRREFETAIEKNIPLFIFVEKNVFSEYKTFKENQDFLENIHQFENKNNQDKAKFKFAHVDSLNVFKFLDTLVTKPIKTFDKIEQIENYLQSQFAGLFYLYLDGLQKQKEVVKVLNSVEELNNITLRMNTMLNSVGEKILGKDNHEYEEVISEQFSIITDFFCDRISDIIQPNISPQIENNYDLEDENLTAITDFIYYHVLNNEIQIPQTKTRSERANFIRSYNLKTIELLNAKLEELHLPFKVDFISLSSLNSMFKNKVKPYIINAKDEENFKERLSEEVDYLFSI